MTARLPQLDGEMMVAGQNAASSKAGGDRALIADPAGPSTPELTTPASLLALKELDVVYQGDTQTLWSYMRPAGRPSFTHAMLSDFEHWQSLIMQHFGPGRIPLKFLVLGSRAPGVFCFGGDLALFHELIQDRDRSGLERYGHRCCAILHRNMQTLNMPVLTIGLVEGSALGGGFEALLSFDYIVAERDATFGLPEIMFGLFPGMGAHAFLSRKLGSAMADRLIVSNKTYSAEEMHELGLVHHLAEKGEGQSVCRDFIKKAGRRHAGMVNARKAMKVSWGLELEELNRITELWADAALQLSERDLKVMARLASAQQRLADAA
ncbi:crotonase/enoyl-CoA hydratase family protein [Pontixanthobacter sp.]|uniref:crotonase/enoyl-CoA hydratase family protein n=1 Tax=Pontixanthobacter sp. TaxID=2792078 RepID=UPI003C7D8675